MSYAQGGGPMKWWGWGDPEKRNELGEAAREMLRSELGEAEPTEVPPIESVSMPAPRELPSAVSRTVGPEAVVGANADRLLHAGGKSYPDLVRVRSGAIEDAPDAIVLPSDAAEVASVIDVCAGEGVAVVPFGGGTSVVGGVDPVAGSHRAVVALDLSRMKAFELDRTSLIARLGPGLRGPQAEAALTAEGLTLGHFPQSFEFATIGGFAATRSAGQASAGYGRFDDLVSAIEMATPSGPIRTLATKHTAAGPALRELIVGSEGTLGVITDVSVRVRPAPATKRYEGWIAEDFESGAEVIRTLAQSGALPDVTRLSDPEETRISLAMAGMEGLQRSAFDAYLRLRKRAGGCMLIVGWEGTAEDVERRRSISARILRKGGAVSLGQAPGKAWAHGRFEGPYLRDELMSLGYFVETLETSHTWSRYQELYDAVRSGLRGALEAEGTPGIVMCHLSHAYADGASLYYTFIAPSKPGSEIEHWRAVKTAACEAIVATGGTITHHHAVGRDHAPYMQAEVGEVGLSALRALKSELDPAGIMNPGKLVG
ncbi:MAG TPA: FAD-binding oxidoreductase [Solirubrobacterales bacterium]|nr:FAD-binding oxidoreductase [Solirubrobacterales bacterium]